jgi:hypothetical protein
MILSSADILRILGGSEIIRLSARIKVADQKPTLSGDDQLFIYISRFPSVAEFEATWTIWLEGDGETALVAAEIKRLLPKVELQSGLITTLTTTDFRSEHTQTAPEVAKSQKAQIDTSAFEERFQSLREDIEDRMLLVGSGRNGKDGRDGVAGRDGRDGKDIDATQTELFDLKDVEQSQIALKPGQVLTWDGSRWTNLHVRQSTTYVGGGGSGSGGGGGNGQINSDTITSDTPPTERENGKGALRDGDTWWKSDTGAFFVWYADGDSGQWVEVESGEGGGGIPEAPIDGQQYARQDATWTVVQAVGGKGGIEEAPMDGNFYVRQNGSWIDLKEALSSLGVPVDEPIDGGNFTTGFSAAATSTPADGGNFTTGSSSAEHGVTLDGGNYTSGQTAADEFSAFGL